MADCIWTQKDAVVTGTFLFAWRQYCFKRRKVEVAFCILLHTMKSGWWRHRYQQGLLVDVGNILYLILGNMFHPFSMSLHSVLLLKQQISFARMVQLWRAGNGILILTSLSEQRPRHDVCGISDRVCGDMQSILHACVRFLSLLIVARWWKSCRPPPPKRFSDTPNPKATHCLLFAVCFV